MDSNNKNSPNKQTNKNQDFGLGNQTQQESPKKPSNLVYSPNEHKKEQKYYCGECKMEIDSSTRQLCGKYACYNS